MQITVELSKNNLTLPIANNEIVQGLIYNALKSDPGYSKKLHGMGRVAGGRKYKLFTFGELIGKYEIHGKNIVYVTGVKLTVRSCDAYLIQLLFSFFISNREVKLGDNLVEVKAVNLTDDRVFDNCVRIKTLSPITVYVTDADNHTEYFTPFDQKFYAAVVMNARRKWISRYGNDDGFDLQMLPTEKKNYVKRATRFKTTFITGWHGSFVLKGSPAVLDFLFQTGLGSKNSQGFGMFGIEAK